MKSVSEPPRSWSSIQILRGLAALAVVLHHIPQYILNHSLTPTYTLEAGAAGVDIFFVISGFVMHAATVGKHNQPVDFFAKRLARILPIYWLFTTTLFLATVLVPSAFASFKTTPLDWLKSMLFLPVYDPRGYIRPIISQGWTLYFELTFYSVLALSLFLAKRRATLLAATLVAAASTTVSFVLHGDTLGTALQLLSPITLEFCAGVLLAHLFMAPSLRLSQRAASPYVGLLVMAAGLYGFRDGVSAELGYPRVLSWGVGAVLTVAGALLAERWLKQTGSWLLRQLHLLGDASYSLYLVHGLTFSVAWKALPHATHETWLPPVVMTAVAVAVAVPFHKLVELRLNQWALALMRALRLASR
jgi:exopolysaccharide production protein ExoZ